MDHPIEELDPDGLRAFMASHREKEYSLVDVRQPGEYEEEHIPGARLVPLPELEDHKTTLGADKPVIVYCHSGRRSMAAAALLADDERTAPVFSLMGGIAAWDGTILQEVPRVKLFEDLSGIDELLYRAMELEKGAWRFYNAIVDRFSDAPLLTEVQRLAGMERTHARTVYQLWKKHHSDAQDFDSLFATLTGDVIEDGRDIDAALDALKGSSPATCLELIEIGLDMEYRAYDLYRTLAYRAASDEEKKTLLVLSEQEKGHVRVLARSLSKCTQT